MALTCDCLSDFMLSWCCEEINIPAVKAAAMRPDEQLVKIFDMVP